MESLTESSVESMGCVVSVIRYIPVVFTTIKQEGEQHELALSLDRFIVPDFGNSRVMQHKAAKWS